MIPGNSLIPPCHYERWQPIAHVDSGTICRGHGCGLLYYPDGQPGEPITAEAAVAMLDAHWEAIGREANPYGERESALRFAQEVIRKVSANRR